ncbi:hypothetical protein PO909_025313 [Leuciscus waleckii]
MPVEPETVHIIHIMPAKPKTVHVMSAVPVSSDKMAAAPESAMDDTALMIVVTAMMCVCRFTHRLQPVIPHPRWPPRQSLIPKWPPRQMAATSRDGRHASELLPDPHPRWPPRHSLVPRNFFGGAVEWGICNVLVMFHVFVMFHVCHVIPCHSQVFLAMGGGIKRRLFSFDFNHEKEKNFEENEKQHITEGQVAKRNTAVSGVEA